MTEGYICLVSDPRCKRADVFPPGDCSWQQRRCHIALCSSENPLGDCTKNTSPREIIWPEACSRSLRAPRELLCIPRCLDFLNNLCCRDTPPKRV